MRPAVVRTAKVLIATLLAWQAASWWLPGEQRYLAVATALAMVSAPTVYRSVTQALRSVAARAAGLAVAVAVVWLLGPAAGSAAAIPAIALVVAGRRGSDGRLQIASTAVLALAAATAVPVGHVVALTLATLTGAAVGIAVNALILPPVHLSASDSAVRGLAVAMGELLVDMGRGVRERQHADRAHAWLEKGRRLEDLAVRAHEDVRESRRACAGTRGASSYADDASSRPTGRPCALCTGSPSRSAASPGRWPTPSTTTAWGRCSSTATRRPWRRRAGR
ncbi:hypothetical protein ACIO6T_40550 [Streptomyces sp. NPDC087532]|uniref:hypothetical protein n=1 Tax=Streptomyces sp. NPDC087532 TaxID=3365795 RepID=UPI0037FF6D74